MITLPEIVAASEAEVRQMITELKRISPATDRHEYDSNETANSGIIARLIAFKPDPGRKPATEEG